MAVTRIPIPAWAKAQKADERLELSLSEIKIDVRTVNCLDEQKIFTVRDLLNCTPERLLEISNFGPKTLETVYAALEKIGFHRSAGPNQLPAKDFALLRKQPFSNSPGSGTTAITIPSTARMTPTTTASNAVRGSVGSSLLGQADEAIILE